ncbi:uncharacterized protein PV09_08170 [Verruconis gallopava]|uniref:C2H2-type domain-containing protein n=1 Tax=Verruconis gallopava TaxID=253628 RepID=A0A0D2A1T3_9PEZI|nr:uncharacterized protein PV09_08170 [Verruconis gallopava]KIW00280.1 hypothetical protein PV09_08170 [Verruconis gallopava]
MATATMTNGAVAVNGKNGDVAGNLPSFPPPKTDKPRPHVCTTCGRSFARLEHLKRHERSHTKEKPFECPQCTRCFARRDLLLRHQQKLHQTGNTSSRPRGRRESASGAQTGARGRKNSIASSVGATNGAASSMRPRANTISHIDMGAFNAFLNGSRANGYHSHHTNLNGFGGVNSIDFRAMSTFGHHGNMHGLSKLDTSGLNNINLGGGMRTAPIMGDGFDFDKLFGGDSTVNPAQLHFSGASGPLGAFQGMQFAPTIEDEDALDWTGGLGETLMDSAEHAIADGSSPSAISTASHSGFSEVMLDGSNMPVHTSGTMWNNSMLAATNMANSSPFPGGVDPVSAAIFPELVPQNSGILQSTEIQDQQMADSFLFTTSQVTNGLNSTSGIPGIPSQYFQPPSTFDRSVESISSPSANGSSKQSSMSSMSTNSITDATRQALLFSLSNSTGYGHTSRQYSQSSVHSPISPAFGSQAIQGATSLPSTRDLQRYVSAYIHYFHPHMPFLHIPTLTFNTPVFTTNMRSSHNPKDGVAGGGGCLILAMAAIGALYEFEHNVARELFEASKRMIKLYLDERCIGMKTSSTQQRTPTWLVQAMLLNLIYGHQCGDKMAAESATIQCAALVGLAKTAELDKPDPDIAMDEERAYNMRNASFDTDMNDEGLSPTSWNRVKPSESREEFAEWFRWKSQEERKRTLYSVFVLSSLLVTAYNQQPRILNSELHLDLPCEEDLWAADSVHAWQACGGHEGADASRVTFADALTYLLTASQRQPSDRKRSIAHQPFGSSMPLDDIPESDLKPSTFGCYVLINALHVYIWETRQRHSGRQWKPHETAQMHAQIEPALRAWQAAWKANPNHNLDRPNPYGPLPADSIPLLDLAYVRLFVNLGRSKEAFWQRDFEAMAKELGEGSEIIQNADHSRGVSTEPTNSIKPESNVDSPHNSPQHLGSPSDGVVDASGDITGVLSNNSRVPGQSTKRERHLRKAAFYAADSLAMADKLGVTFADFTSRELPIQSAMCTFDCAQVLAEWVATVQDRVGRFLGIIGRDDIDYSQVPAIMLLEEEDVKLIRKINEILNHAEVKIAFDAASLGTSPETMLGSLASVKDCGDASKILLMTSYMLNKAAVWGITKVMSQAMHVHAEVLKRRAEASLEA